MDSESDDEALAVSGPFKVMPTNTSFIPWMLGLFGVFATATDGAGEKARCGPSKLGNP